MCSVSHYIYIALHNLNQNCMVDVKLKLQSTLHGLLSIFHTTLQMELRSTSSRKIYSVSHVLLLLLYTIISH